MWIRDSVRGGSCEKSGLARGSCFEDGDAGRVVKEQGWLGEGVSGARGGERTAEKNQTRVSLKERMKKRQKKGCLWFVQDSRREKNSKNECLFGERVWQAVQSTECG